MSFKNFRPTNNRVQNASKTINGTRTNATIRDIEEEEGELEEKEGIVVSIKRDLINGAGWTVKSDDQTYVCSCATSMYEIPETVERGGILYPKDTVKVKFQINPVLRLNTITEITSLGKETDTLDISQWQHKDEATTIIAKPKSALSISNGFITMNYDNNNKVIANEDAIETEGKSTNINTKKLNINSDEVTLQGTTLVDFITGETRQVSNEFVSYNIDTVDGVNLFVDRSNNVIQLNINTNSNRYGVVGEIKDQKAIPLRLQSQQLITDGNCVERIVIDTNGIISLEKFQNECPSEKRNIMSTHTWMTPQIESRNYIKVIVQETCNYCSEGTNSKSEFINYCPHCQNFNSLINTSISIRCNKCGAQYCQNCGTNKQNSNEQLKKYNQNYISAYGVTCQYCKNQLSPGTNKQYVNYCPNCQQWGDLIQSEMSQGNDIINILECSYCNSKFCSTCGTDQNHYGLDIMTHETSYAAYDNALRKLKYIKDGI